METEGFLIWDILTKSIKNNTFRLETYINVRYNKGNKSNKGVIAMENQNYKQILEVLQQNDVREVVKAIFSYETGITDEADLDKLNHYYFEELDTPNFLDEDVYFKSMEYRGL